jgi:hypothetical protein
MRAWAYKANDLLDGWLRGPEDNAAGRLGLYRILFALFYLWHVACYPVAMVEDAPGEVMHGIRALGILSRALPYIPAEALEAGLVAALIALLLGWRTRLATLAVLVAGFLIEVQFAALQMQKGRLFLTLYIPLFMLIAGDWGATWSLDSRRQKPNPVSVHDNSGRYFLPARALLLLLALFFAGAGVSKIVFGTWLDQPDLMSSVTLSKNIKASLYGFPLNPGIPFFASTPWLYQPALYVVVLFETLFPITLSGGLARQLYVALALVFHGCNALLLLVTFTPLVIVYPLFIDLQAAADRAGKLVQPAAAAARFVQTRLLRAPALSADVAGPLAAIVFSACWSAGTGLQNILRLGGWLDWRTIWLGITPMAAIWLVFLIARSAARLKPRPAARAAHV